MIERIRIVPVEPMARLLAAAGVIDRDAAYRFLVEGRHYLADDVLAGLDEALALAACFAAGDSPAMRAAGLIRDALAAAVLISAVVAAMWALPL